MGAGDARTVRPPAVAGFFYPGDKADLTAQVDELLAAADGGPHTASPTGQPGTAGQPDTTGQPAATAGPPQPGAAPSTAPKALIVPHAGYVYSGPYAALGYHTLASAAGSIKHVVLLGPTHRVAVRGLALPGADALATPLGEVPVWAAGVAQLAGLPQVVASELAHRDEHSLEVHLPFLQRTLDDFDLLPLAVGWVDQEAVAAVLDAVWGGPDTLVVISSDLSHYLTYTEAKTIDAASITRILGLDPPLDHDQACGATPVNGLLVAAQRHHLTPRLLGAGNSGDTAGDKRRVVGYCAVAFDEEPA
ncbi:MAG: AmmeMemoRadiSam system protein B [Bifidobacteriaceae bacterium]|jgi:AmmeMemoRadiSam system protein B|nr:AmmeMemoRadiSam system protein B [Bifidobacteriaceae bacterium]